MKATARQAGALYLLFSVVAVIAEFSFPTFMVPGDATATAVNIARAESAYRFGMLTGFVTLLLHLFVVERLYKLFRDIDRGQALLMVLLVAVGVAVALANLLAKFAPLVLLSGADYLSVFTKPQLDALVLGVLRFHSGGAVVVVAFWGLWLLPFGLLVIKSGYFPRLLGALVLVAGFAYMINSMATLVLPDHRQLLSRIMMPLYFGEVPIIFWLLIRGIRPKQTEAQAG